MNLLHLNRLVGSLYSTADDQEREDERCGRHDPIPSIAHLREAAHILEHLPFSVLASLPAFTPPPPTFP